MSKQVVETSPISGGKKQSPDKKTIKQIEKLLDQKASMIKPKQIEFDSSW